MSTNDLNEMRRLAGLSPLTESGKPWEKDEDNKEEEVTEVDDDKQKDESVSTSMRNTIDSMNESNAGEYYVDKDDGNWCVFHTEKGNGKCYGSYDSEEAAEKHADKFNSEGLKEWSNTPGNNHEERGHVMDQPEGETVDNSLRRYLNADPMRVKVEEDIDAEALLKEYAEFKDDK